MTARKPTSIWDDLYFVPSKDKQEKKETPVKKETKQQVTNIYTSPGTTVVDVYKRQTLDFLSFIGIEAKGDERLGIYLNGLKISGSAQSVSYTHLDVYKRQRQNRN